MTPQFFRSVLLAAALASMPAPPAAAQVPTDTAPAQAPTDALLQISWQVKNRFRLFREQRDFQLHAEAMHDRSVLGSEQWLEPQGDGRGQGAAGDPDVWPH